MQYGIQKILLDDLDRIASFRWNRLVLKISLGLEDFATYKENSIFFFFRKDYPN